MVIRWQ